MAKKESPSAQSAQFEYAADVISALDSQQRLQIVLKLAERDHVVHELVALLGKSQPLVSQHLRVLKRAGLVSSTRSGREVVYRLKISETADLIDLADYVGRRANDVKDAVVNTDDRAADDRKDELAKRRKNADLNPDEVFAVSNESAPGGKTAVAGRMSDTSLDMPGVVPDTPDPPTPRLQ